MSTFFLGGIYQFIHIKMHYRLNLMHYKTNRLIGIGTTEIWVLKKHSHRYTGGMVMMMMMAMMINNGDDDIGCE